MMPDVQKLAHVILNKAKCEMVFFFKKPKPELNKFFIPDISN